MSYYNVVDILKAFLAKRDLKGDVDPKLNTNAKLNVDVKLNIDLSLNTEGEPDTEEEANTEGEPDADSEPVADIERTAEQQLKEIIRLGEGYLDYYYEFYYKSQVGAEYLVK